MLKDMMNGMRFQGAVEHYVDLEILKAHLPKDRKSNILDAGGGTERMALLLAKMGYSVALCDISPGMLNVAKQKMRKEGVSNAHSAVSSEGGPALPT
jgi:ubiquinone/menaquinone biosynthesis C-methylase UbiE